MINSQILIAIPVAYSKDTKKTRGLIESTLQKINYMDYKWKAVQTSKSMRASRIHTIQLFLCQWRSRDTNQCNNTGCFELDQHLTGYQNILHAPLIAKTDILLAPLHVKLGLYKNFIKSLKSNKLAKGFEFSFQN